MSIPGNTATVRAPRATHWATASVITGRANSKKPCSTIRSGSAQRNCSTSRQNSWVPSESRLPCPTNKTAGFIVASFGYLREVNIRSILYSWLRLYPLFTVGMLDQLHLGHEVGQVDHLLLGIAAGDNHVQHRTFAAQLVEHFRQRQVIVVQNHVQLIENDQAERLIVENRHGLLPCFASAGDVLLAVLGVPGEAVAHCVHLDGEIEPANESRFAGGNSALDELDDSDLETLTQSTEGQSQGRRGLALARSGVYEEQPLFAR